MIAFVYATVREAGPLCGRLGVQMPENQATPFTVDLSRERGMLIHVCGMGPAEAREGMRLLLEYDGIDAVVNPGIAGSLKDEFAVGDLLSVRTCLSQDPDFSAPADFELFPGLRSAALVTVSNPVFDPELRKKLSAFADIVDMEGAVIARACLHRGIPYSGLKCVSDLAGHDGREHLRARIGALSGKLSEYLLRTLEVFR